jgi:hypothetical protein
LHFFYGDSSASPLVTDFVDLLRRSLDCCVSVLQAEQRIARGAAARREAELRAEQEIARLRQLDVAVSRAATAAVAGASPDATVTRCCDALLRAAGDVVTEAESDVRGAVAAEIRRVEESAAKERARCFKAWEQLLLVHDLPGSDNDLRIEAAVEGGCSARLHATTPYGAATVLELEVPAASRFARPLRVRDVVEALDLPPAKEGRTRRHELGDLRVTACSFGPRGRRAVVSGAAEEGFDLVRAPEGRVQAFRSAPDEATAEIQLIEADALAVGAFLDGLAAAARELQGRKTLVEMRLDGAPLEAAQPSALVKRLIDFMAPTVREIGARSRSRGELVLRCQMSDGRREERFVALAELREKLGPLPVAARALFAPLQLGEVRAPKPPASDSAEEVSSGSIMEEVSGPA